MDVRIKSDKRSAHLSRSDRTSSNMMTVALLDRRNRKCSHSHTIFFKPCLSFSEKSDTETSLRNTALVCISDILFYYIISYLFYWQRVCLTSLTLYKAVGSTQFCKHMFLACQLLITLLSKITALCHVDKKQVKALIVDRSHKSVTWGQYVLIHAEIEAEHYNKWICLIWCPAALQTGLQQQTKSSLDWHFCTLWGNRNVLLVWKW